MADINVVVTVDTENITPSNLKTTVVLTDDNGDHDTTPGDSETFDIRTTSGKTVQFKIEPKNKNIGAQVSFDSFFYESGDTGVFSSLPSSSNSWTGTTSGTSGENEFFAIKFNVVGNTNSPFTLDPEVEIWP
ncbi:hypothetical protein [Reichenbachiella sp.]|uniref:hypothetical protein n=1 Tax=Reichenbachiella sp. TaxID=2184521 RepID=UPI003B58BC54